MARTVNIATSVHSRYNLSAGSSSYEAGFLPARGLVKWSCLNMGTHVALDDAGTEFDVTVNESTGLFTNHSYNSSVFNSSDPGEFQHLPMYNFVVVTVFNILVFTVGVLGNMLVICVICRVRAMRNPTNYFLFTLSIADLFVLLICQPVALAEYYTKQRWHIGEFMCKLVPLLENGSLHVSVLTIIAMTAERYYAIVYPFRKVASISDGFTVKVIICLWVLAYVCTSPFIALTHLEQTTFYDGSIDWVCRTTIYLFWHKAFIVFNAVAFFALPFIMVFFMYARIIQQLMSDFLKIAGQDDTRMRQRHAHRMQVVKTLIFIIVLFFISMCPLRIVTLWQIFAPLEQIQSLGIVAYYNIIWFARIMMYINSAGNPIIYCISSTKFKIAFKSVLKRYTLCGSGHSRRASSSVTRFLLRRTQKDANDQSPVEMNRMRPRRREVQPNKQNTIVIKINFVERTS